MTEFTYNEIMQYLILLLGDSELRKIYNLYRDIFLRTKQFT